MGKQQQPHRPATANQSAGNRPPQQQSAPKQTTDAEALENTLAATVRKLEKAMHERLPSIEELLPDFMKGQGERLIGRAKQYFARGTWQLQACTHASFIKCLLEAAELGFAIDGRMVHAVPYKRSRKDENGNWVSWYEAQLIPDYKGLIAVAKRSGTIQDAWARVILDTDEFDYYEQNGEVQYRHRPDLSKSRDSLDHAICVLSVATHRDGWFRTDIMTTDDVLRIRGRSQSYKDKDSKTPWNSDPAEMAKKTALKRLLKTFEDDPGLIRIMELDDRDYQQKDEDRPQPGEAKEKATSDLASLMADDLGQRQVQERSTKPLEEKPNGTDGSLAKKIENGNAELETVRDGQNPGD